jgi:hypothetical protein
MRASLSFKGSPKEVFSHEQELNAIHLGTPFFVSLVNELRRQGVAVPEDVDDEKKLEDYLCR